MNVFYFSSDLFVSAAATSILSLMENNSSFDCITIYMIDDGIKIENKRKLSALVEDHGHKIIYIDAPDPSELFDFSFKDRYQLGHSYMRMAVGTLLPPDVDRVLALDCDTLILGDLSDLWNMDMGGNILAGVVDCLNLKAYKKQFGLTGEEFYCNAGMYLVDLKKWREQRIEDTIKSVIAERNGNVFFFEQTLMNYSCRGKIAKLQPEYNTYTLFYAFKYTNLIKWRKPTIFYAEHEIEEAKKNPVIIHFTKNFYMISRPWIRGCDHPLSGKYIEYKKMTPWSELDDDNRSLKQKIFYKLWHIIPQSVLAVFAGFIYNEIRPRLWWKNE